MEKNLWKKKKIKTRELTKNEKFLLSLLAIVILLWIVYRFGITPQTIKLEALNLQKTEYQKKIDEMNDVLRKEDHINKEWDVLHKEKKQIVSRYFPRLDQAQIIYLLNDLIENENVSVVDLNFNRPSYEDIGGFQVRNMEISIPYGGSYDGIEEILNSIRNSPRKILVDSLSMDRDRNGELNGNMSLKIYSLEGIVEVDDKVVYIDSVANGTKETPFSTYDDFDIVEEPIEEELIVENEVSVEFTPKEEDFLRKELLHDFELKNYDFIPSSPMIKGNVSSSVVAKSNKYSSRLEYNILALEEENRAYIDLSKSNITLKYPPSSIGMWVHSYGYSSGTIGIRLKGQAGEILDTKVSEGINWMGWRYVEATPPTDVKLYPLIVDKIYYELPYNREDFGVLLFDKLEAIYPKGEGEENEDNTSYFFHLVEKDETLESVSKKYYGKDIYANEIMKLNDIKAGSKISEGKILVLIRR